MDANHPPQERKASGNSIIPLKEFLVLLFRSSVSQPFCFQGMIGYSSQVAELHECLLIKTRISSALSDTIQITRGSTSFRQDASNFREQDETMHIVYNIHHREGSFVVFDPTKELKDQSMMILPCPHTSLRLYTRC